MEFSPGLRGDGLRLMNPLEHHTVAHPTLFHTRLPARQRNHSTWPDAWLINAVRRDPPDDEALNMLVDRYWQPLYERCRMLTLDGESASDLAQDAWLRVIRARGSLQPDGNFHGYIMTVATNLWRDSNRANLRAGPVAENRMASLESPVVDEGDEWERYGRTEQAITGWIREATRQMKNHLGGSVHALLTCSPMR